MASVPISAILKTLFLFFLLLSTDASFLKHKYKLKSQPSSFDLPVLDEPEEIEFPRSSDQSSRIPRAISYGWSKSDCLEEEKKNSCLKCKCTNDDCMVLTETCAEVTVCPLVQDKPVSDPTLCCPKCPTYGDGSLEALEAECSRREQERARLGNELCPGVCVCTSTGPFVTCSVEPVQMCRNECETKYGSDPCAKCECDATGSCTLIMQVQSEPFCGEEIEPVQKEGVCGLTCP